MYDVGYVVFVEVFGLLLFIWDGCLVRIVFCYCEVVVF